MTILLTEKEMLDVAYDYLDILPNPDNAHEIAKKMDMQYIGFCDMYWDVEKVSLLKKQSCTHEWVADGTISANPSQTRCLKCGVIK